MFRRVDQSTLFNRIIKQLSSVLARQRGLPIVIGIIFVLVSFVIQLINTANPQPAVSALGVIFLHVGVLVALIGILLAEPLGK